MTIKKINYKVDHLDFFGIEDKEKIDYLKEATLESKESLTLLVDGKPICAIGLRLVTKIAGEVWLVNTPNLKNYKILFIKDLEEIIKEYAIKYKLKRLQTLIEPEFIKWIEFLGFARESEMVNFLPNKKTYLYRRLF